MRLIVGLTGPNAAGKGAVAARLAELGFRLHSLSDVIRDTAKERGLPPTREHLIRLGNLLRQQGGPGVLAEKIIERLGERDVVDSIRNPAEVAALRRVAGFTLVAVSAPTRLRFDRALVRARPGDPRSLEEFEAREAQENSRDPRAQQLEATARLADHRLENGGDLDALSRAVDRLLAEVQPAD